MFLRVLSVAVAPGCSSSSSSSPTSSPPPGVGERTATPITAASGGQVTGTGVTLDIPAGALAADTTITIDIKDKSKYADSGNIAVNVFEFGPDGTTFSAPVPITLDLYGKTPPSGKEAKIAYYDGSTWQTMPDSAVGSDGKVTATTTHFTPFTVVWVAGQQTGGGCASLDFTPCGGDVTGSWTFTAACVDLGPGSGDPTKGSCPTATGSATVDFTGTATFNSDMTYSINTNTTVSVTYTLPASCVKDCNGGTIGSGGVSRSRRPIRRARATTRAVHHEQQPADHDDDRRHAGQPGGLLRDREHVQGAGHGQLRQHVHLYGDQAVTLERATTDEALSVAKAAEGFALFRDAPAAALGLPRSATSASLVMPQQIL